MKDRPRIIIGREWARRVCEALGLDAQRVRRIVVDAQPDEALHVYVEYLGDERMLSVSFPSPDGVEIKRD